MASKRTSKYEIQLEIAEGDKTRSTIDAIERSLKSITTSAKSGDLANGIEQAGVQAEELAKQINDIASSEKDATKEIEAYSKAATKAIAELEKQSSKITYSLSEQGKEQRARISELKKELSLLGDEKAEKARAKELQKELKKLHKDVLDLSDEELEKAQATNRAVRTTLKMAQQDAKLKNAEVKANKTLSQLVKADVKSLNEKIKAQLKFVDALRTTEGRYNLVKKAAEKAGKAGLAIGKAGLKAGAGIIGGAVALGGAAIASAGSQVDREREAMRIKAPMSDQDKQSLVGQVYGEVGGDYTSIVDAINRVTTVLGTGLSKKELVQAASAELRFPGTAAMFKQQNTASPTSSDFVRFSNRMKALQGATGASVDQITSSTDKIANLRQKYFSNASMTDLQAVFLGLQGSGAFDTDEELNRAFDRFVRSQSQSKDDVFTHAQSFDWTKSARGATNKTQVINTMKNMDWASLKDAASVNSTDVQLTEAEQTAKTLRQLEETKNQILIKVLKAIAPLVDKIDVNELEKMFNGVVDFFSKIVPVLVEKIKIIADKISEMIDGSESPQVQGNGMIITDNGDGTQTIKSFSNALGKGGWFGRSAGGIASTPSLVAEAGFPEMVVPLSPDRQARGQQLTQNLNQYFQMSGSETTALSLSQAVKSRDFTRAMMHNSQMDYRLGR